MSEIKPLFLENVDFTVRWDKVLGNRVDISGETDHYYFTKAEAPKLIVWLKEWVNEE